MEDTLLYPRELIAERVVFTPADYPYSDTYMSMLCNTTSCGHFKHS
jgi:hypothetical protein